MRLVDSETAALALGVTARRVQQLVKEGRLVNHGTPRRVLVELDALYRLRLTCG